MMFSPLWPKTTQVRAAQNSPIEQPARRRGARASSGVTKTIPFVGAGAPLRKPLGVEGEPERPLPGGRLPRQLVHDEARTVFCYDTVSASPGRHKMSNVGYEESQGTVRYRCPTQHEGWECPSDVKYNPGLDWGLRARIPCTLDLRRFPPIPRATKEFERLYRGRTPVDGVNTQLKIFWGADDGDVTGARRFHAFVGAVMVVQVMFATLLAQVPGWEGRLGQTRLGPVAEALRQAEPAEAGF
jgi:hypothetical protein